MNIEFIFKPKVLSLGLIVAIVLMLSVLSFFILNTRQDCNEIINSKQYGGFGADLSLIGCYGILAEEQDLDNNWFQIYDHANKYTIARLINKNAFKIYDERLYLIEIQSLSENVRYDEEESQYYAWFFDGEDFKRYVFETIENIPKHLSVDVKSGEVTIYSNKLDEISEVERAIFIDLEK